MQTRQAEPVATTPAPGRVMRTGRRADRRLHLAFDVASDGPPTGMLRYLEPYLTSTAFDAPDSVPAAHPDLVLTLATDVSPPVVPGAVRLATLPLRVHLVAALDGRGPSSRERARHARRVARFDYSFGWSGDDADFDAFYDRMHVPTMTVRHGSLARSQSRADARETLFRHGGLLLVRAGGVPVGGVLCRFDGDTCHARLVGWLDGDPVHLEREVLKSANHHLLGWAAAAGFARVDFQGCEPFLRKGTLQSKRHLGTTVIIPASEPGRVVVGLDVCRDTPAVRDLLVAHPAIGRTADGRLFPMPCFDALRPLDASLDWTCDGLGPSQPIDLDDRLAALR